MKNIILLKLKQDRGFTLAEMLVTVGVFAIAMSVSSSIFINVNNLQQQTANMAKLQNEGRYVLEKIGKEIRGRELDYDAMAVSINETTGMTDTLIFKEDEIGEVYSIVYDDEDKKIFITVSNGTPTTGLLSSEDVIVEKMKFKVMPVTNPYASDATVFEQPRVTIMMEIKNGGQVPDRYRKVLQIQTTISSKIYK